MSCCSDPQNSVRFRNDVPTNGSGKLAGTCWCLNEKRKSKEKINSCKNRVLEFIRNWTGSIEIVWVHLKL